MTKWIAGFAGVEPADFRPYARPVGSDWGDYGHPVTESREEFASREEAFARAEAMIDEEGADNI